MEGWFFEGLDQLNLSWYDLPVAFLHQMAFPSHLSVPSFCWRKQIMTRQNNKSLCCKKTYNYMTDLQILSNNKYHNITNPIQLQKEKRKYFPFFDVCQRRGDGRWRSLMENFFHVLITEGGWGVEPDTYGCNVRLYTRHLVTLLEEFGSLPLILYVMFGWVDK